MHQDVHPDYQGFLSEVLKKYILVFGANVINELTAHMTTLKLHTDGTVLHLDPDPVPVVQEVLSQLHMLSDAVYISNMPQIIASYPGIAEKILPHGETVTHGTLEMKHTFSTM